MLPVVAVSAGVRFTLSQVAVVMLSWASCALVTYPGALTVIGWVGGVEVPSGTLRSTSCSSLGLRLPRTPPTITVAATGRGIFVPSSNTITTTAPRGSSPPLVGGSPPQPSIPSNPAAAAMPAHTHATRNALPSCPRQALLRIVLTP